MPGIESSQGASVAFDGVVIGYLTGYDVDAKAGSLTDVTNVTSPVTGTGSSARVRRSYDCTSVEPATISITFWGPPSFSTTDCGRKATLAFVTASKTISGSAILLDWKYSGKPNQYTSGSATFQFEGA